MLTAYRLSAGERHEERPPPPTANGFSSGYGPNSSAAGGSSRDALDSYGYAERTLPPSANPYAIPAPAAAATAGSGLRGGRAAAPAAAPAANGGGGGSAGSGMPASQSGFATQMQSQYAFTQSFAGLSQGLSQDSFVPPSEIDFSRTQQSQQPGLSQAVFDSFFDQQQQQQQQ